MAADQDHVSRAVRGEPAGEPQAETARAAGDQERFVLAKSEQAGRRRRLGLEPAQARHIALARTERHHVFDARSISRCTVTRRIRETNQVGDPARRQASGLGGIEVDERSQGAGTLDRQRAAEAPERRLRWTHRTWIGADRHRAAGDDPQRRCGG